MKTDCVSEKWLFSEIDKICASFEDPTPNTRHEAMKTVLGEFRDIVKNFPTVNEDLVDSGKLYKRVAEWRNKYQSAFLNTESGDKDKLVISSAALMQASQLVYLIEDVPVIEVLAKSDDYER